MRHLSLLLLSALWAPGAALAQPRPEAAQQPLPLEIPFEKYKLPNGLEVIFHVDKKLPVVAVNIWYHVGAFHESPGRTGFAHLFEHMMFQGSKHVGDDVHLSMLEKLGATDTNGTTNFDRTNYFQTVPSHHLETALWLESDRMGFLLDAVTQESLQKQQDVVKNERRQGKETAPYGLAHEKLWHALFPLPHPYHGMVIGSMEDLEAARLEDVKAFFQKWYAPSNATLTIAGDFEPVTARALVEKYFGPLPTAPKPAVPQVAKATVPKETVIRHEEQVGKLPLLMMTWHTPAIMLPGDAEADLLATVLGTGKSSRLYRRLVHEKQLAQSVSVSQQSLGHQSVFTIQAVAGPGVSTQTLQREIDAVLEEVRQSGVTREELERARNRYDTRVVSGLQSIGGFGGKADLLQTYNHHLGNPGYLKEDLARYAVVTPAHVRQFAQEFLRPQARVVLHAVPPEGPAPSVQKEQK